MAISLSHALTAEDQARQSRHQIRKELFFAAPTCVSWALRTIGALNWHLQLVPIGSTHKLERTRFLGHQVKGERRSI